MEPSKPYGPDKHDAEKLLSDFEAMLLRNKAMLWHICTDYRLGDGWTPEDCLQEVMISLWRSIGTFEGRSSERTWVWRVATNTMLMLRRKSERTPATHSMEGGMEISADFIRELGLDTITDLSQVDSARFNQLTGIIARKINDIVNNLSVSDTDLPDMDEYISTLANEVADQLLKEVVEGLPSSDSARVEASNYGHHGYVSAADNSKRTIWLFFYDNQAECNMILTHIKEDLVVQQNEQKRG